jgi:hypothetical protein
MTYTQTLKIPTLTEETFQDFLQENLKSIFVYETEDYDYRYYFPSLCKITGKCQISKQFMRQC